MTCMNMTFLQRCLYLVVDCIVLQCVAIGTTNPSVQISHRWLIHIMIDSVCITLLLKMPAVLHRFISTVILVNANETLVRTKLIMTNSSTQRDSKSFVLPWVITFAFIGISIKCAHINVCSLDTKSVQYQY